MAYQAGGRGIKKEKVALPEIPSRPEFSGLREEPAKSLADAVQCLRHTTEPSGGVEQFSRHTTGTSSGGTETSSEGAEASSETDRTPGGAIRTPAGVLKRLRQVIKCR